MLDLLMPSSAFLRTPLNPVATAGNAQVTFTFNTGGGLDESTWRVYWGTAPNPTAYVEPGGAVVFNDILEDAGNNSTYYQLLFSGLANGTTYYFRVASRSANGEESVTTAETSATPQGESQLGRGRQFRSSRYQRASRV